MLKWFSVPIMDIQLYIIFLFTDNKSFQKSPFCHLGYVRITWYLLIGFYNPSFIKVWSDHRGNQKQYIEGQTIVVYMWLQSSTWGGSKGMGPLRMRDRKCGSHRKWRKSRDRKWRHRRWRHFPVLFFGFPCFFLTIVVVQSVVQVPWLPEVTECHVTPKGSLGRVGCAHAQPQVGGKYRRKASRTVIR